MTKKRFGIAIGRNEFIASIAYSLLYQSCLARNKH